MNDETDEFRQQMEQADMSYPSAWRPNPGDLLIAVVRGYDSAQTKWGKLYVATVEREDDGEQLAVWLSHKVLREEFNDKRPQPGERIGIRFHGEHPEQGYERYTLKIDLDRDAAVPDFERRDPPREWAAVNAADADAVADEVERQRQQQDDDGGADLPEGDPDEDVPF